MEIKNEAVIYLEFPFSVIGIDLPSRTTVRLKGTTVEDLFRELCSDIGKKMRKFFLTDDGKWNSVFNILVNEKSILELNGKKTVLTSGDVVTVLFPYSGG
jgi:molybdopterin converting factor small subunit